MTDLLSLNKSYTSSPAAHASYPDKNGKEMTDGVIPSSGYTSGAWTGWASNAEISINLGKKYKISYVRFFYDVEVSKTVRAPASLTVYGSNDGTNYTSLQTFSSSGNWVDSDGKRWSNNLILNTSTTYKYIKMAFTRYSSGWLFLGELQVYGFSPSSGEFLYLMV